MKSANLVDWAETFLRHRDLFTKRIERISREGETLTLHLKTGGIEICHALERLTPLQGGMIVTRNTAENLKILVDHWKEFVAQPGQKLVFVSQAGEKWILIPSSHDRIAEPEYLGLGLQAMHDEIGE